MGMVALREKQLWSVDGQAVIFKAVGNLLICLFVTVLALIPRNSSAEMVNATLSPATSQVLGSWNYSTVSCNNPPPLPSCIYGPLQISDYFAWSTINDVCNHLYPGSLFDGNFFCVSANVRYIYLGNAAGSKTVYTCPTGITPNSANQCASCPAVTAGQTAFTLDSGGSTCSRPDTATCPIDSLPALPKDDLCTLSLEKGSGKDVDKACPDMVPEMQKQAQCLANKINKLPLMPHYTEPSATIRTTAYQNHLLDVFKLSVQISRLTDAEKQVCAARIADVNVHKIRHGIVSEPSASDDKALTYLARR
jgi:hypothetical protein